LKLTFLGTGTSFGVPQIGCDCEVCRSTDPRDKRNRVGAFVESNGAKILIDTPPELRLQLLANGISSADAVLITHDHADHVNGLDDIRPLSAPGKGLSIYGPPDTLERLATRFSYVFDGVKALPGTSKPEAAAHPLRPGERFNVAGQEIECFAVSHGPMTVYGYRIGDLGYVTDAKELSAEAVRALRGVKVLVLNALFPTPHPTHLSIPEAVAAAQRVGAARTFLTHLTHRSSHASLERELPNGIAPAYDGLTVNIE
jgi:Metal-dependent hydrolases of the beta-lactamase superfamily I